MMEGKLENLSLDDPAEGSTNDDASQTEEDKRPNVAVFISRASTDEAPRDFFSPQQSISADDVFLSADEDDGDDIDPIQDRSLLSDYEIATSADEAVDETQEPELTPEEIEDALARLQKQIEFYFGDENFARDRFLRTKARQNPSGWIDLGTISSFKKMRKITRRLDLVRKAATKSEIVVLNDTQDKIKRKHPLPKDPVAALSHTVVLENLPKDATEQSIKILAERCGHVHLVRFHNPSTEPMPDDVKVLLEEKASSKRSHIHPGLRPTGDVVALVEMDDVEECNSLISKLSGKSEDWRQGIRGSLLYQKEKRRRRRRDGGSLSPALMTPQHSDSSRTNTPHGTMGSGVKLSSSPSPNSSLSPKGSRRNHQGGGGGGGSSSSGGGSGRRQIMGPDGAGSPSTARRQLGATPDNWRSRSTEPRSWRDTPGSNSGGSPRISGLSPASSPMLARARNAHSHQRSRSISPSPRTPPGSAMFMRAPRGPVEGERGFSPAGVGRGKSPPKSSGISFQGGVEKIGFAPSPIASNGTSTTTTPKL